ncbi:MULTISPECIES: transporter substrate-binding domain-containing protein [unclassified Pseudomonas]|uniref:substrate-binding periplasmic protein n=1 Tax=unclassified Pseudomonas TaxID=196821 RepID=UPI00244759EF|nr:MULTISPECIES: transporter substrate-binding domain-containing protein [unclassified Pseudomonas]MDG9926609.1 transporter substrate-binding domain-containing protein [Pseudomonas sp. GD04042]MDH0482322.1 transporter substrate-binding domain-containing protein [Pseudomonas sp. GD04015]MDH0603757.1 transporter substrate-binding domain-containing protein [Pseudomonas sp. GD03869]
MRGISLLLLSLLGWPLAAAELQLYAWERAPLVQQRPDGGAAGLVPELADELFRRAGIGYRLSFLPLQRALHQVQQQPRSCVLLVERQQEREPHFGWVGPLLVSRLGLYAKADDDLQLASLEQVRGLRVLSHQGSGAGEYLQSTGVAVIYSNKESLNLSMLQRSRARLWATSSAVADSLAARPPPREVLPFLTLMEDIACHPDMDPAELRRLQRELWQMYREGWVQALYRRHGMSLR